MWTEVLLALDAALFAALLAVLWRVEAHLRHCPGARRAAKGRRRRPPFSRTR